MTPTTRAKQQKYIDGLRVTTRDERLHRDFFVGLCGVVCGLIVGMYLAR